MKRNLVTRLYVIAERHEQDCWNALTRHTAGCPACLEVRKVRDLNGYGCAAGLACREEWLKAARKRYELSPYRKSMQGKPYTTEQSEGKR